MEIIYVNEIPYSELKKIIFSEAMHASKRDAHAIFQKIHNIRQIRNDSNICINLDYFNGSEVSPLINSIGENISERKEKLIEKLSTSVQNTLTGINTRCDEMRAMSYMLDRIEECEENRRYYVRII